MDKDDRPPGWIKMKDKINVRVYPFGTQLNTLTTKNEPPHRVVNVVDVWGTEFQTGTGEPAPIADLFQRYGITEDGCPVKIFDMPKGCEYRYYYGVLDEEECWVGIEQVESC